jgi:hypothetical protein
MMMIHFSHQIDREPLKEVQNFDFVFTHTVTPPGASAARNWFVEPVLNKF